MRIATGLFAAVLLAGLAGCVGGSAVTLPLPDKVALETNGHLISLVGPGRQHAEAFLGVPRTNYFTLRSSIDMQTGETLHQVYVSDSYFGAERNWDAARDAKGRELRFIAINKNEITCSNGCSYSEEFAAAVPETMLRSNPQGFAVTFTAKSGELKRIEVPGELIAMQLAALDAARAKLPAAAAGQPPAPTPAKLSAQ